jgi:hypothetical protein
VQVALDLFGISTDNRPGVSARGRHEAMPHRSKLAADPRLMYIRH